MAGLSLAVCAIALAESVSAVTPRPDSVVPRLRPLDGWAKACEGVTTVEEILRVTQEDA